MKKIISLSKLFELRPVDIFNRLINDKMKTLMNTLQWKYLQNRQNDSYAGFYLPGLKEYQSALGCTKVYESVLGCTRAYYGAPKYTRAY